MSLAQRLEKYCLTPAMSGFEERMIKALQEDLRDHVDELRVDVLGNVIATIKGTEPVGSDLMIFAHTDSIGMIVKAIGEDGFIRVERVGGIPERILAASKVIVQTQSGEMIKGVIGFVSHHLTPPNEKYIVKPINECYLDIGATSATEVAAAGVRVGSPVMYQPNFERLINNRVSATTLDDRGGCAVLVELAEHFYKNRPRVTLHIVGTVQEEFNLRGAMVAAQQVRPTAGISLDLTVACDTPDIKDGSGVHLGGGPSVGTYTFHGRGTLNGVIPHPRLLALVDEAAEESKIPLQRHAMLGGLTDGSYVQLVGDGVACVDLSWPTRYTHSGVEMCSLDDLEGLTKLLIKIVENFPIEENFSRA
ncbi:MAG: M42 family metallopeptidase [Actinobacteria bacterium]|nr:M42 family metallopeptidase [Actinomycetota bacterium]